MKRGRRKRTKGSALLVAFLLRSGNHAIVTFNWHSWIVNVVTFKPSMG